MNTKHNYAVNYTQKWVVKAVIRFRNFRHFEYPGLLQLNYEQFV